MSLFVGFGVKSMLLFLPDSLCMDNYAPIVLQTLYTRQ